MCNGFVDRLVRSDVHLRIRVAPLQGETAQECIPNEARALQSLVFLHNGKVSRKSAGVLRAAWVLGGWWRLSVVLWPLQVIAGDWTYDWVARNRYRWFGKQATCRIPTPEEAAHFLP